MRHRIVPLLALVALAIGVGACSRTPKIIKYDTGINNLKQEPQESKADEKRAAAQTHTELGAQLMQRGDLKSAYQKFKMAIDFDATYAPAHTMLAILDEQLKQPKEAEQEYQRAVAIDPNDGDANNNLGVFLCKTGRQDEAMEHFQRALADPFYKTPAWANTNAGACLLKSKDYAGAETYLHKALELDPDYPDGLYQMAHLLYLKDDAFHARAFLQRFEAQGRESPDALLLGRDIETKLGDEEAARNYATRLRAQFPDSEQAQRLGTSSR